MAKESIDLLVRANGDQFNRELDKSGKKLDKFKDKTKKAGGGAKKFGMAVKAGSKVAAAAILTVAAAAAVATTALIKLGAAQMNELDALGKTADKLGTTTEALASLRFAAEQSGLSAETLDMALQRMGRRSAAAAQGQGELVKTLEAFNIDAKEFANLPVDKQLDIMAEKFKNVENANLRNLYAMSAFDSEGVAMVNMLKGGAEGLAEFRKQAEELGIAIDRDSIAKIEESNDAWNKMKKAIKGAGNSIAVVMAPIVQWIAEGLTTSIIWARKKFEEWRETIITWAATLEWAWNHVGDLWDYVVTRLALGMLRTYEDMKNLFTNTIPTIFIEFGKATGEFFENLVSNIGHAIKELWDYITSFGDDEIDFKWDAITEGFAEAAKEVAKAHNRAVTEGEDILYQQVKQKQEALTGSLTDHIAKRLDEFTNTAKDEGGKAGRMWDTEFKDKSKKAAKALTPNAVQKGTQAAFDIILGAKKAREGDPQKQMVEEQKVTNEQLQEIKTAIENNELGIAAIA
jgi:hypothetical protein